MMYELQGRIRAHGFIFAVKIMKCVIEFLIIIIVSCVLAFAIFYAKNLYFMWRTSQNFIVPEFESFASFQQFKLKLRQTPYDLRRLLIGIRIPEFLKFLASLKIDRIIQQVLE